MRRPTHSRRPATTPNAAMPVTPPWRPRITFSRPIRSGKSEATSRAANKKPGIAAGLFLFVGCRLSGRLFLGGGFSLGFLAGGLGTTARALGERGLDLLDRLGLGDLLPRRDFARQPVERGFVKLPLGIGLLRLGVGPEQVAHHLGDGDDVARIDLGFVFLRPARPHGALDARAALERLERT